MPEPAPPRLLRLILVVAGVGLVLLAALGWLGRRQVAREALVGWLRSKGVAAEAQVEAVGPSTFIARVRLGDPRRPDFIADRVWVRYRLTAAGPQVRDVTVTRPVLRAALHAGRWSAGSLDPLIREFLAKPPQPGAPRPRIAVDAGRLLLASDYGPLDLAANLRVAQGRLVSLAASSAPARLRGPGFDVDLGAAHGEVAVRGGTASGQLQASGASAQIGGATLHAIDARLLVDAPYPDLARGRLDTPVSLKLAVRARDATLAGARLAAPSGGVELIATLSGPLQDLALQGRTTAALQAAHADVGGLQLARLMGGAEGDVALGRRGYGARLTASAAGDGGWTGLGAPAAGDLPQTAALKRAARAFHFDAAGVSLDLANGRPVVIGLPSPVRLASASGARAELAAQGGRPLLGSSGGAFQLSVSGGGLPSAQAQVARLTLAGGVEAEGRLHVRGTLGLAEGADITASGRLSATGGRIAFAADRCVEISAGRLELGLNDVEHPSGRLCPTGAPLFTSAGGRWRVAGRAEGVAAAVPFLQARASAGAGPVQVEGRGGDFTVRAKVQALQLDDAAPERRFNPVQLSGAVGLARQVWQADFAAREASGHDVGRAHLVHDGGLGAGFVTLDSGPLVFSEGGLQPVELSPLAAALGPPVTGRARFHGRFDWARAGAASSGTLSLQGLDFASAAGRVEGLAGEIAFQSLAPLVTAPDQVVRIAKVDAIVPVTDLSAKVGVSAAALAISGGEAAVGGGHVRIESLEVPFDAKAPVRGVLLFEGVQLHDLVEASPFGDRVDLDARVSGRVPFSTGQGGTRIAGGQLKAIQPGRLSIQRTALSGVEAEGAVTGPAPAAATPAGPNDTFTDFAYQAMENLAFDTLEANVQSQPDGRLGVLFHIVGKHDPPQRQEIRLSIMDLIRKRFLGKTLPLPSGTGVNLTLDTTLNLDDLLSDYAEFRRLHGSAGVQP